MKHLHIADERLHDETSNYGASGHLPLPGTMCYDVTKPVFMGCTPEEKNDATSYLWRVKKTGGGWYEVSTRIPSQQKC